eukprot:TRINITY_DN11110_c0_g1_i1.p1 TRINITY_DN11110_c0_g1~~TRINITY_DN11110_c0_g1_i1.p1  ORF type:complete len:727 (+),score=260.11 TRINITY_DN11110_c0_g1_i1:81-2261(+)
MSTQRPSPPSRDQLAKSSRGKRGDGMFSPPSQSPTTAQPGEGGAPPPPGTCASPDFDEARELKKMEERKTLEAEVGKSLTNVEAETIMRSRDVIREETGSRGALYRREYHDRIELVLIRVVCIENIRRAQRERDQDRKFHDIVNQQKVNLRVASYGEAITASTKKGRGDGAPDDVGAKTPPPNSLPPPSIVGRAGSPGTAPLGAPLPNVGLRERVSAGDPNAVPLQRQVSSRESRGTPESRGKTPPLDVSRFVRTDNVLGKGAFGVVYEGFDQETGRFVAIKEATFQRTGPNVDQQLKKIINEVRMMKQLNHPNIVQYIAAERSKSSLYIYMELVNGGSITSAIASLKGRGFPENIVKVYTRQLCRGLGFLHSLKVAHRDIKGDNVLLDKGSGVIKLADFNSSKQISDLSCDGTNTLAGTLWYMAPEMIQGRSYSFSADVWSLGITVIEMLTGAPPFVNDFNEKGPHAALFFIAQLQDPYPMPEKVRALPNACAWLKCCLTRDPNNRSTVQQLTRHQWLCEVPFPERTSSPDMLQKNSPLFPQPSLGELRDAKKERRTHGYSNHAAVTTFRSSGAKHVESPLLSSSLGRSNGLPWQAQAVPPSDSSSLPSPRPGSGNRLPSLSSRGTPLTTPDTPPLLAANGTSQEAGGLNLRRKIDITALGENGRWMDDRFNQMFPTANLADAAGATVGSPLSMPSPLSNQHNGHPPSHNGHKPLSQGLQVMSVT